MAARKMATPQIEIVEASAADRSVIENLAQLYQYDFSEMSRRDTEQGHIGNVQKDGLFHNIDFDRYYANRERHEYLVRVDGYLGGFALVLSSPSYRDAGETVWHVGEFFVMRKYRRLGVGEYVATALFDRFEGLWQVAEMSINPDAQEFWRGVIGRYTQGDFEEVWFDDDNWLGPVQYFHTKGTT